MVVVVVLVVVDRVAYSYDILLLEFAVLTVFLQHMNVCLIILLFNGGISLYVFPRVSCSWLSSITFAYIYISYHTIKLQSTEVIISIVCMAFKELWSSKISYKKE